MDIVVWLRSLGLGKYEPAFRENDIDETVLPGLTHETLKELGVVSFGHRMKLLDAIAALRTDASGKALRRVVMARRRRLRVLDDGRWRGNNALSALDRARLIK